ncbi:MAG: SLC13 family permease [Clostridiales bacterium]|nr:SLC13 family permease [Clostridiales bacterium]
MKMKSLFHKIKSEGVMLISLTLATLSMFFVHPGKGYVEYIDFRTLALLFCLMTVMAGFNQLGLFRLLARKLLEGAKTVRGVILTLVLLCFFCSMVITNDVALITFVPLSIITLNLAGLREKIIFTVTLETIAANLGSMLTPIGNPQNLFLFSAYDMSMEDFVQTLFPFGLISLLLLILFVILSGKESASADAEADETSAPDRRLSSLYTILFVCALLSVFKVLDTRLLLVCVLLSVLIFDRKTLKYVDYSLLLTFTFLFIFIGNLGNIPGISRWLEQVIQGNEVLVGILASQVFSNVPAAILLSKFTNQVTSLLIGVNLGGLGTLIASMASLISFKFVQKEGLKTGRYMGIFTAMNLLFLAANCGLYWILT